MTKLAVLRHDEGVRLDAARLVAIYAELGEARAEQTICRAMEELASRLNEMQRLADEGRPDALARSAAHLVQTAQEVGLPTFARVACDVVAAVRAGDGPAQAATLARLVRIGDRSLTAVWDLRDMTL